MRVADTRNPRGRNKGAIWGLDLSAMPIGGLSSVWAVSAFVGPCLRASERIKRSQVARPPLGVPSWDRTERPRCSDGFKTKLRAWRIGIQSGRHEGNTVTATVVVGAEEWSEIRTMNRKPLGKTDHLADLPGAMAVLPRTAEMTGIEHSIADNSDGLVFSESLSSTYSVCPSF